MLTTLADRAWGSPLPLPHSLVERYGGPLGFPVRERTPYVVANFVATLDGVVSYRIPGRAHAGVISGGNEADRFVMGLLRACADVVVVGAGTLREERDHVWTPADVFPAAASDYAALRAALGKPAQPALAFVTASGEIDLEAPVFRDAGLAVVVVTTDAGAERIRHRGARPAHVRVEVARGALPPTSDAIVVAVVAATGARLVLTEGGPTLLARFLADGALDELFLTLAPQIAGREPGQPRLALVEGHAFAPERAPWGELLAAKRAGDHLFLRYAFRGAGPSRAPAR